MRRINSTHRGQRTQRGFTLIEAIVATALFTVLVGAVINVYLYTVKLNRRTTSVRAVSENSIFISEFLSKEIRNGQVDYGLNGSVPSPCSSLPTSGASLAIYNVTGDHDCFYLSGSNLMLAKSAGGSLLTPVQVNDSRVKILSLSFSVAPTCNPYTSGAQTEPQVTINAQIQSNIDSQDLVTLPLQTTISIPRYDITPAASC